MRAAGQPDAFVVTNGPEDGAEHTVVRAPFHVGSDESCNVFLRLDKSIEQHHALVTAVSQGYRVRNLGTAPVWVDGKRATMLRSRIVRNGGVVNVGDTRLALDCAPDGLAYRSKGIVGESDFGWMMQHGARFAMRALRQTARVAISLFGRIVSSWLALVGVVFLLYVLVPPVRYFLNNLASWAVYYVRVAINSIL